MKKITKYIFNVLVDSFMDFATHNNATHDMHRNHFPNFCDISTAKVLNLLLIITVMLLFQ